MELGNWPDARFVLFIETPAREKELPFDYTFAERFWRE
jgi:hypothetical protein